MFDLENIQQFLIGANRFYESFNRRESKQKIIWQEGSTRIIDYTIDAQENLPILFFIPSLINKSYILDLNEQSSMVKYFARQGFRVYLVDFSDPLPDESDMNFSDYINRINNAINAVCQNNPFITIGYCLGGVFSCMLLKPKNFLGQILIATPIDFLHFQKIYNLNNSIVLQNFKSSIEQLDRVPHLLIQMFFSYIDPSRIWQKFCQFATMQNQEEVERFLSVEQWVNDGISIPKKFCLECLDLITENSLENLLSQDTYNFPTLIINGSEDKIVPIESSLPLYRVIDNKEILVEKTGHIGLIISQISKEKICPSIVNWIKKLNKIE